MKKPILKSKVVFVIIICYSIIFTEMQAQSDEDFHIVIERQEIKNDLITGTITVNNEIIGHAYENDKFKIPAGNYKGFLRYFSPSEHAQGPFGTIGSEGDFLIEIGNVPNRTHILLHGGQSIKNSKGCIMLGGIPKKNDIRYLEEDHALRKLRLKFYGTEIPTSTPLKNITIDIIDNFEDTNPSTQNPHMILNGKFYELDGTCTGENGNYLTIPKRYLVGFTNLPKTESVEINYDISCESCSTIEIEDILGRTYLATSGTLEIEGSKIVFNVTAKDRISIIRNSSGEEVNVSGWIYCPN